MAIVCRELIKTGQYFFVQNWNNHLILIFALLACIASWIARGTSATDRALLESNPSSPAVR